MITYTMRFKLSKYAFLLSQGIYFEKSELYLRKLGYDSRIKVLDKLSAKGTMAYISVSRGRLRCALQSKLPLVSLDNLGGLHFNFVGKNIERKKHATSRECLQFTMHRKVVTVICFII